jgi:hypothetical protein
MPEGPKKGEEKSAFISRCVSYLVRKEGKSQQQALGQCYGMWNQGPKKKKKEPKVFDNLI